MMFRCLLTGFRSRATLQAEIIAAPSSTDRAATNSISKTTVAHSHRSMLLGVVVSIVVRMAFRPDHRQTADCYRMAPPGIPVVLDLEDSARPTRTTTSAKGNS